MTRSLLVNRSGLDELKERGLGFEPGSIGALHFESARHRTEGCRQRTARSVFEGLSWLEDRLLADDPRSMDLLRMTRAVHDGPMSVEQLDGRIPYIRYPNRVQEEPVTGGRVAVFGRKACTDLNADTPGFGFGGRFEEIAFGHTPDASRHGPSDWRTLRR